MTHDDAVFTLGDAARSFLRHSSPRIFLPALAAAIGVRFDLGHYSWRDIVLLAGMLALDPIAEWLVHAYLLHAPTLRFRGRELELSTAREHRAHHVEPSDPERALLPWDAMLSAVPVLAGAMWLLAFPLHALLGGDRLALALTAMVGAYALLGLFEWSHFLIHSPYRPRGRYYGAIRRNHLLHHYKNEHYWFGITSTLGDHLLGTFPRPTAVPRSDTAHPAPPCAESRPASHASYARARPRNRRPRARLY